MAGFALLPIRCYVEGNEQHQVRGQNAHAGEGGELLTRASASIGKPVEVGGSKVGPGCEVDEACDVLACGPFCRIYRGKLTEIDDELDDLETSDPFFPPAANTTGALEVVPIHDHVDGEVKADDDPGYGGAAEKLSVAKNRSSTMVVTVQEGWRQTRVSMVLMWRGGRMMDDLRSRYVLRGFFLRKRKTVSKSSRYLVR